MPAHLLENPRTLAAVLWIGGRQQGRQLLVHYQPCCVDRLIGEEWMLPGDALPPTGQPFAAQLHEQDAALGCGSKTGLKWLNEGKA